MAYNPNSILPNLGAGQPLGPGAVPRYGTGPGDLGMADPQGITGMSGTPSMGFPATSFPAMSFSSPSSPYRPSTNPFRPPPGHPSSPIAKAPVEAQPPAPGGGSIWDALKSLFAGSSSQGQGMTGMLNTPRGVDSLGNPVNRF